MGQTLSAFWDQTYFIPKPTFTENDLPDLTGKVYIITGGYTGIGFELAKLLYPKNATLYIAGRSASKASTAIKSLQSTFPASRGRLEFLSLDLADLSTISASASAFLAKEERLDVLTATNVYGPFLFTKLLLPVLRSTAKTVETGTVRVTWAASFAIEIMGPKGGVVFVDGGNGDEVLYGQSKIANVMLGVEGAKRWGGEGIISNSFNPGHLASELTRHAGWMELMAAKAICYPVKCGAYTELYAGWSPDITPAKNGCYIIPWGRIGNYNTGLQKAISPISEAGDGAAEKLWTVCEKVVEGYL
ncbi:NAD(P)-binding protein [Lindgomyces ingoldianus]|uniref:NAD(P)-binding protein n=1 Tax=Lindgomyces ingoldianus TaxID=673940 RepID=A0ACB6Q8L6_9PLEO|nr:NAD(P)-binding protein [Lindgomyces ingoldianus]KAF2463379.1 NAD(P)-binding protein [Lindgomyces ingoldianus]